MKFTLVRIDEMPVMNTPIKPQAVAVGEAVERGLSAYAAGGGDPSTVTPVCTIMVGRLDDWLRAVVERDGLAVHPVVLDATGIAAFKRAISLGRSPEEALQIAGVTLSGSISRLVLSGGRDAILGNVRKDRQAVGWARLTDKDPCAWCSMLASRGPVYRSRHTAEFAAHDHCACMPIAAWSRDEAWLQHSRDLYEQWQQVTAGHSGADARKEWRRYWDNRKGA